jgi:hypothetical protein
MQELGYTPRHAAVLQVLRLFSETGMQPKFDSLNSYVQTAALHLSRQKPTEVVAASLVAVSYEAS